MDRRRSTGPREPDLAHGGENGGDAEHRDHGLGRDMSGRRVGFMAVDHSSQEWFGDDCQQSPDRDAREGGARWAWLPTADVGEDDGVCDETEVQYAVDGRGVEIPKNPVIGVSYEVILKEGRCEVRNGWTNRMASVIESLSGRLRLVFKICHGVDVVSS